MFFEVGHHILLSHMLPFFPLVCLCGKWTQLYKLRHVISNSGIGGQVRFSLSWSILVHPYLLSLCILGFFVVSQLMWFGSGSTVIVYIFGVCVRNVVWASFWVYYWILSHNWLLTWYYTCTYLFLPLWCHFFLFFHPRYQMELWFWCIQFYFFKSHFWQISNFWCNY